MSVLSYTLHTIFTGGKKIVAGLVAEFSDFEHVELAKLGAVRAATDDEALLYQRMTTKVDPKSVDGGKSKAKAPKAIKAETDTKPAEQAVVDGSVTTGDIANVKIGTVSADKLVPGSDPDVVDDPLA